MGLLDNEDKVADSIMEELGFDNSSQEPERQEPERQEAPVTITEMNSKESTVEDVSVISPISYDEEYTSEIDAELTEAEKRLAKAQLYKEFIVGKIFDGEGPGVKEVSEEFRTFARRQLQTLLGVVPKPEPTQFTEDEVKVIKIFVAKILQNPKLLESPKTAKPPTLQNKAGSSALSTLPPTHIQKPVAQPPKKPQLRSRHVPEEVKPQQPQKTTTQAPKPNPVTVAPSAPDVIPADESIVEEDGQRYKIKYVSMPNIDEYGIMDGGKIRKLPIGQSCTLSNGIRVLRSNDGVSKILKTMIATNSYAAGRKPFPSISEMEHLSLNSATQAAAKLPTLNSILKG
jgi:hypothetical protein